MESNFAGRDRLLNDDMSGLLGHLPQCWVDRNDPVC
jgi:hypothetical protein